MKKHYSDTNFDINHAIMRCEQCGRILSRNACTSTGLENWLNGYDKTPVVISGEVHYCYVCPNCGHRNF